MKIIVSERYAGTGKKISFEGENCSRESLVGVFKSRLILAKTALAQALAEFSWYKTKKSENILKDAYTSLMNIEKAITDLGFKIISDG